MDDERKVYDPNTPISLELTIEDINAIYEGLGNLRYNAVKPIIEKLELQLKVQLEEE